MKRILIAAGGTGGHIIPALSIAKELKQFDNELLFVGNRNSIEEKLVKAAGYDFRSISIQKLYRRFTPLHIKFPFKLVKSTFDSMKIIRDFRPDIFLGTGGFVSGPVGYAAKLKNKPIFIQEQNSYPGKTSRILASSAKKIFIGTASAQRYFPADKVLYTGNPINSSLYEDDDKLDLQAYSLRKNSFKLFVIGGSQGSYFLNKSLIPIIDDLLKENFEIIWQTGNYSYDEISRSIGNRKGIHYFAFDPTPGKYYNSADIALSRCGAITLAELETKMIPSLLVPLPSAAGNHQFYNGMEQVANKRARMLEQKDLTPEKLKSELLRLKNDQKDMKQNFGESVHLHAALTIARILNRE